MYNSKLFWGFWFNISMLQYFQYNTHTNNCTISSCERRQSWNQLKIFTQFYSNITNTIKYYNYNYFINFHTNYCILILSKQFSNILIFIIYLFILAQSGKKRKCLQYSSNVFMDVVWHKIRKQRFSLLNIYLEIVQNMWQMNLSPFKTLWRGLLIF